MSRVRKAGNPALLPYARWVGLIALLTAEILTIGPRLDGAEHARRPTILEKVSSWKRCREPLFCSAKIRSSAAKSPSSAKMASRALARFKV